MKESINKSNSTDKTIERNYVQKWRFLITEYEEVKRKEHPTFMWVRDFYAHHQTNSQTFRKYYNRYLQQDKAEQALLPEKRGPKWKTRRTLKHIEEKVIAEREKGNNRYELVEIMKEQGIEISPSTAYRICKRYDKHLLNPKMVEEKRQIIRNKIGSLGHIDLHQLSKDSFLEPIKEQAYVIAIVDTCSRLAWAEVIVGKKGVPVAFKALKLLNTLKDRYNVQFEEMLSDNGSEFSCRSEKPGAKDNHAFEYILQELGIKHRYTKPYRPQTNGKVERFWRTLDTDMINGTTFDNLNHFKQELLEYMIYYNEYRTHQAINNQPPLQIAKQHKIV